MGRKERIALFSEIEKKRGSKLICYITGDRTGLETKIGIDIISIFQDILINTEFENKPLDLLIYSTGGLGIAALSLVSLIREYVDNFRVIVPIKAYSAATLIALGANSIFMLNSGQLSPVDVNITTPFNPTTPSPNPQLIPINVEDLSGFVRFSEDVLDIKEEANKIKILECLAEKINPLAIGAVHRARERNKKIASTLLQYHLKDDKARIDSISDIITTGLYEHSFIISKRDARSLGLNIEENNSDMEKTIWNLFTEYSTLLKMNQPYNQENELGDAPDKEVLLHRAIIEYKDDKNTENVLKTYSFSSKRKLVRTEILDPNLKIPLPNIIERDLESGWYVRNDI